MAKKRYITVNFKQQSVELLATCNQIIVQYQRQGLRLTLRQLYYQLVSRNVITNQERSYKNLGNLLSQGRLAGVVDWTAIEDRIRKPVTVTEWESPRAIMNAVVNQYRLPRWEGQREYVELWVEKDALAGVLEPIARQHSVTLMVNRGYSSQSAMKEAAERLEQRDDRNITILYIGDLDPSGEDMVRDVSDRLFLLTEQAFDIEVEKLAITPDQVAQYNPPPNPAKMSDSRAARFVAVHGYESYEADALPPDVLAALVREAIQSRIDADAWNAVVAREEADKELLRAAAEQVMQARAQQEDDEEPSAEEIT